MKDFALILHSASRGNHASAETLLPLVYEELRKLAYARMASQAASHTLQPTALVHEAWLRMVDGDERTWHNRAYFFSAAAMAMRNILIDHARKKSSLKRGGDQERVDLDQLDLAASEPSGLILMVDDALRQLEEVNPKWARIVVLKYFGGMTNKEVADTLEISESSIERYWSGAKVWLYNQMSSEQ